MTIPSRYQAVGGNSSMPWTQIVNAILGSIVLICLIIVVFFLRARMFYLEGGELGSWFQFLTISLVVLCTLTILSGLDFIFWVRGQGFKLVMCSMGLTAIVAVFTGCFVLIAAQNTQAAKRFERLDRTPYDWYNQGAPGTVDWDVFQATFKCCGSNDPRDWFMRQPAPNSLAKDDYNPYNPSGRSGPESVTTLGHYGPGRINATSNYPARIGPEPVPIPPRFPGQDLPPRQPAGPQPYPPGQRFPQSNQIPPQFPPNNQPQPYPVPNNNYDNNDNDNNNNNNIQPPPFPPSAMQPIRYPNNVLPPSCCRKEFCSNSFCYCETKSPNLFHVGCRARINTLKHRLDYLAALMILLGFGSAGLAILYSQVCIVNTSEIGNSQSNNENSKSTRNNRNNSQDNVTPGFKATP